SLNGAFDLLARRGAEDRPPGQAEPLGVVALVRDAEPLPGVADLRVELRVDAPAVDDRRLAARVGGARAGEEDDPRPAPVERILVVPEQALVGRIEDR